MFINFQIEPWVGALHERNITHDDLAELGSMEQLVNRPLYLADPNVTGKLLEGYLAIIAEVGEGNYRAFLRRMGIDKEFITPKNCVDRFVRESHERESIKTLNRK